MSTHLPFDDFSVQERALFVRYVQQYNQFQETIRNLQELSETTLLENIESILARRRRTTRANNRTTATATATAAATANTNTNNRTTVRNIIPGALPIPTTASNLVDNFMQSTTALLNSRAPANSTHIVDNFLQSASLLLNSDRQGSSPLLDRFLNTTVPVRPTPAQLERASRLISYRDIEAPLSSRCPISLEEFHEEDTVRQLLHCNHIFQPTSFDQWFSSHVGCPVCRYDVRNYAPTSGMASSSSADVEADAEAEAEAEAEGEGEEGTTRQEATPAPTTGGQLFDRLFRELLTGTSTGTGTGNGNDALTRFEVDPSGNAVYFEFRM